LAFEADAVCYGFSIVNYSSEKGWRTGAQLTPKFQRNSDRHDRFILTHWEDAHKNFPLFRSVDKTTLQRLPRQRLGSDGLTGSNPPWTKAGLPTAGWG